MKSGGKGAGRTTNVSGDCAFQKLRTFVRHQSLQRGSWVCICEACCDAASGSTIFDDPSKENIEIGVTAAKQQMPEAIMPFKTSNFCLLAVTATGTTSA